MDVIDIGDDDQHISRHLSSLSIESNITPNGLDTPITTTESSATVTNVTIPTTARQTIKRSRIASDDSLIAEFVNDTLQNVQNTVQTERKTVSWG